MTKRVASLARQAQEILNVKENRVALRRVLTSRETQIDHRAMVTVGSITYVVYYSKRDTPRTGR